MMRVSKFAALTSQDAKYKTTCFWNRTTVSNFTFEHGL
jgi:hypothetical protein